MKRPLFGICVCLLFLMALFSSGNGSILEEEGGPEVLHGKEMILLGKVTEKDCRIQNNQIFWKITLSSLSIQNINDQSPGQNQNPKQQQQKDNSVKQLEKGKVIVELTLNEELVENHNKMHGSGNEEQQDIAPVMGGWMLVKGVFLTYEKADNPGEFDARRYYYGKQIFGRITKTRVLETKGGNLLLEWCYTTGEKLCEKIEERYPKGEAGILKKMLLGDSSSLDRDTKEVFQEGGILHVLAISGLHITLLGMGVCKGLRFLGVPALIAAMLGGGFLVLYGNMVGFGISVCRAIGMYLVRMLGEILQRDYDMLTAMGVLALGIALSNPAVLTRCDYLLSFGAVTALGIVLPSFGPGDAMVIRPLENRYLYCIRRSIGKCREMLRVSVSISLFTLPIQLFFFFEAPMYGVMVNLLVLPLMSVLIGSVFGALLCPFSFPFVWMGCLLLGLFQRVCILSTSLPGHLLVTGKPGGVRICLYYAVLLAGVMLGYREQKEGHKKVSNEKRGDMPWRAFWIALLLIIMIFPWGRGFTMHVISVGQGECIMVENGKGQTYLFDCGSSSVKDLTSVLLPYFKYYGITKLDGVFLSHGDQDHICGLEGLLQKENKLKIQNIYLPVGEKGNEYETILSLAKEQRIPVKEIGQGDQFVWKNTKLTCLYPGSACDKGSGNERSACFLWEVGKRYFLLTGDLEGEGEEEVMKLWKEKQGIDVLKVAHHGSKYSTGEEFLHTFRPRIAVISVGERNSYHHPHEETLERLEKQKITYYRTDRMGEIVIGVKKGEIYVKTWKK